MKLYKHKNYDEYKKAQVKKNKDKINVKWVKNEEIKLIATHIKKNIKDIKFGLCHGVRNGFEVKQFRTFLNIEVIGTEISNTARKFDNVIEWDFHKVKNEWLNNVDFIYSNAFDHSYDPEKCLSLWMSCLKNTGICYIHQTINENRSNKIDEADCFAATLNEYRSLFNKKNTLIDEISIWNDRIIFCIKR